MPWTIPAADPPLVNPSMFGLILPQDDLNPCGGTNGCIIRNRWFMWNEDMLCFIPLPQTTLTPCSEAWKANYAGNDYIAWTGFLGCKGIGSPMVYSVGGVVLPPTSVGARIFGQQVDDAFGTAVGSDGRWLYISAPDHTALQEDVPDLGWAAVPGDRTGSGVVYQLRTDVRTQAGAPNMAQLWVEPGVNWPEVDIEIAGREDYTMPVPHQYIIESVGATRGNYGDDPQTRPYADNFANNQCISLASVQQGVFPADLLNGYEQPTGTAGYYTNRTPQIVGPHADAHLRYVRALGDVDGDGVRDFAVGSEDVKDPASGTVVGAIYIVYGQSLGFEGDYLLEKLQLAQTNPERLKGIMLKGASTTETLSRAVQSAGDFNGDGADDVVVGSENAPDGGEAIVLLGSRTLESPENGWTVDDAVLTAMRAVRFSAVEAGDLAGANVGGAGDIDGDGYDDILIAAPGAADPDDPALHPGVVYLIYGSEDFTMDTDDDGIPDTPLEFNLSQVGTPDLPGIVFVGRADGDKFGGGDKRLTGTVPANPSEEIHAFSNGVVPLGDLDGDGLADYAITAMLADPQGRLDAGEVYVLYGRSDD